MAEGDLIYGDYYDFFKPPDSNESLMEIGGSGHGRINEPIRTEQLNTTGAPQPPQPPSGGPWDVSRLQDWMRSQGISEHVIGEEANQGLLDRHAGDIENTLAGTLERWKTRSTRPTASAGGVGGDADPYERATPMNPNVLAAITRAQSGGRSGGFSGMGNQFTDPYTSLFEDVAKRQLARLDGQNAQQDRLMALIDQQLAGLSNPGYSPEQLSVMRTQALEPIERDRAALNRRVTERTAARGFMPTSGLHELDLREVDRGAEERRTVAQRDLAINQINRQDADRMRAIQLAQLGLDIPIQQGQQAMSVANSLYQLPRTAMMDSLQVLNASSPQSAISPMVQLQQLQQQQAQQDYQNNVAFWQNLIASMPELFR